MVKTLKKRVACATLFSFDGRSYVALQQARRAREYLVQFEQCGEFYLVTREVSVNTQKNLSLERFFFIQK